MLLYLWIRMSKINIDELIKILPKLIKENDQVKGAIITALSEVMPTREDIRNLSEKMDKRFEKMDKRFETLIQEMDKRFAAVDKRFEKMDKRFEKMDKKMDRGFSEVKGMLGSLLEAFGKPFEQFGRNVVSQILEAEGEPNVVFKNKTYSNPNKMIFDHPEVEIDGVSEDPPYIVEVTSILREKDKVDKFIRRVRFLQKKTGKKFKGFLVA